MKNLKRVLSLALSTAMVLGMMVVGSSAAGTAEADFGKAIATVKVLEIMEGDENGNFNADKVVTRNEMAVVMSNLKDLKLNGAHPFTDVPSWADKYVAAVYTNGISAGTSATTYGGSQNVTTTQAALMLMKTLGWFEFQGEFGDDWALATVKKATELKLFKDIDAGVNEGLSRGELAQMIVNALENQTVTRYEESGLTVEGNGLTVTEKPTYSTYYGDKLCYELYEIGSVEALWDDDEDLFGRPSVIVTYEDNEIEVARVADKVLVADEDTTLADLVDDAKLKIKDFGPADDEMDLAAGAVVELFINEDDSKVLDDAVVYYYVATEIEEVEECDEDADEDEIADGASVKADGILDIQIDGVDADELVEGAFIVAPQVGGEYIYETKEFGEDDREYPVVYGAYIAKTVEGKVKTVKGDEYVTVDGTKYVLADTYAADDALEAGKEFELVLDANGFVVTSKPVKEGAAVIDDVYVVDVVWTEEETGKYNKTTYKTYAQLVDMAGEITTIELEAEDKASETIYGDEYDDQVTAAAWAGKLVTVSDKKWESETSEETYKANNDKFDLAIWSEDDEDIDEKWDIIDGEMTLTLKKNDTRIELNDETYRLNSKTQYLMLSESGEDLAAAVKVGGVALTEQESLVYVICEDGKTTVQYVIIIDEEEIEEDAEYSEDLIFIKGKSSEEGDGFVAQTVYYADGKKDVIEIADDQDIDRGFYTYALNEDGYYEIEEADALEIAANDNDEYIWDDEEGVIVNVVVDAKSDLYEGLLTVDVYEYDEDLEEDVFVATYEDIDVSDAKFVDAHDKDTQYDKTISSVAKLADLLDKEVIASAKLSMNVSEDGAVIIILTDAE